MVQPSDSAYYPLGKQGPASPKGKRGVCEPARACVRGGGREGGKECVPPATRKTRENVAREVESAGRARTKALLGAAASLSAELPGPWNWDLAPRIPHHPLVPLSSRLLSLPGAATSAVALRPLRGLVWPPRAGAPSQRAFTPPRHPDSSTFPFALFIMQVPARASRSRWEKAFGD